MAETKLSDLFDFCPVCGSGKSQRHEYDCEFVKFESELTRTKRALKMAMITAAEQIANKYIGEGGMVRTGIDLRL